MKPVIKVLFGSPTNIQCEIPIGTDYSESLIKDEVYKLLGKALSSPIDDGNKLHFFILAYDIQGNRIADDTIFSSTDYYTYFTLNRDKPFNKLASKLVRKIENTRYALRGYFDTVKEALFYTVILAEDDPNELVIVCENPDVLSRNINDYLEHKDGGIVAYSPTRIYVIDYQDKHTNRCRAFEFDNFFTWFPRNPEGKVVTLNDDE